MGAFVATINTPGYSPWAEEVPTFDTARAAWEYLREEIERQELAYEPMDPNDPEGPGQLTHAAIEIERQASGEKDFATGTVYGPSYLPEADEDTNTDLGLAYSVTYDADAEVEE